MMMLLRRGETSWAAAVLVGVLASLAAVAALPTPDGDSASDSATAHVRDKRRLPEPGFIVPATPMGFARQERMEEEEPAPASNKEIRSTGSQEAVAGAAAVAERKSMTVSSAGGSAASTVLLSAADASADELSERSSAGAVLTDSLAVASSVSGRKAKKVSREAPPPRMLAMHGPGRAQHMRAIASFLDQTRKLGVSDETALTLLDKELAKAKRQQAASQQRPVYHATPVRPYGSLINFNESPYEKYQLKNMKPIKEQQNDIPPPSKPIVVESEKQHVSAKGQQGQQTQAVATPSGPLPVTVPVQLDPLQHLVQTKPNPPSAATGSTTLVSPHYSYHTVALPPAHSYQQVQSTQDDAPSAEHSQSSHAVAPVQQVKVIYETQEASEMPVSLEALHGYPSGEQHTVSIHPNQIPVAAHAPVQTVHQPVYVYQEVQVAQPQPEHQQAEQVEHPGAVLTHAIHVPEPATESAPSAGSGPSGGGLYGDDGDDYASQYRFGYRVRDEHGHSDYGHAETREGATTKGEYFVTLPDGRLQHVKYWAGPDGFHAHVSYTNQAAHPGAAAAPASGH